MPKLIPVGRAALLLAWALPVLVPAATGYAAGHYRWFLLFTTEDGPAEWATVAAFAWSALSAWGLSRALRARGRRAWPLTTIAACALLLALEEISWGQRLFGWNTPQWLASLNGAGETNLHNLPVLSWLITASAFVLTAALSVLRIPAPPLQRLAARIEDEGLPLPGLTTLAVAGAGLLCIAPLGMNEVGEFLCALAMWSTLQEYGERQLERFSRIESALALGILGLAGAALHMAVLDEALFAAWTGPFRAAGLLVLALAGMCSWQVRRARDSGELPLHAPGATSSLLLLAALGLPRFAQTPGLLWWSALLFFGALWVHLRSEKLPPDFPRLRVVAAALAAPVLAWCVLAGLALELGVRVPPRADLHAGERCDTPAQLCWRELRGYFRERPAFISQNEELARYFECERSASLCDFRSDDGTWIAGTLLARTSSGKGTTHYIAATPLHFPRNRTAATLFWLMASGKTLLGPALLSLAIWWILLAAAARPPDQSGM